MVGVALSACASAASIPRAASTDESRTAHTVDGPAATAAPPALRPSPRRASAVVSRDGRAQPADARGTLRSLHLRASTASAAQRVYAEVDRRTRALDAPLRARITREILADVIAGTQPWLTEPI